MFLYILVLAAPGEASSCDCDELCYYYDDCCTDCGSGTPALNQDPQKQKVTAALSEAKKHTKGHGSLAQNGAHYSGRYQYASEQEKLAKQWCYFDLPYCTIFPVALVCKNGFIDAGWVIYPRNTVDIEDLYCYTTLERDVSGNMFKPGAMPEKFEMIPCPLRKCPHCKEPFHTCRMSYDDPEPWRHGTQCIEHLDGHKQYFDNTIYVDDNDQCWYSFEECDGCMDPAQDTEFFYPMSGCPDYNCGDDAFSPIPTPMPTEAGWSMEVHRRRRAEATHRRRRLGDGDKKGMIIEAYTPFKTLAPYSFYQKRCCFGLNTFGINGEFGSEEDRKEKQEKDMVDTMSDEYNEPNELNPGPAAIFEQIVFAKPVQGDQALTTIVSCMLSASVLTLF